MYSHIDGNALKQAIVVAANTLEKNKEVVNALNVFPVPDGDTGTNMSKTMQAAVEQVKKVSSNRVDDVVNALANGSLMGARGNSGVILSQIFRGFAKGLKDCETANIFDLVNAMISAKETAYKAVMKPIEGTVLTITRVLAEKAPELAAGEEDIIVFLEKVIREGEVALASTTQMLEQLRQANVVDAGGKGLLLILKGAYNALTGNEVVEIEDIQAAQVEMEEDTIDLSNIKYTYCTGFIVNGKNASGDALRQAIEQYGDSIVVAESDEIIKVHIHSNEPGTILQVALGFGKELIDINIDNMKYQHKNNGYLEKEEGKAITIDKKYSIIAVSAGEGINKVFKDMNVDHVIYGGQTMNPSTEDILNAINAVSGENVIILPNNKNIIMSAEQAKELSERNVHVLPTKTIPQGLACMIGFSEEADLDQNLESMMDIVQSVKSGEVTYAVRETSINGFDIKENDIMGIYEKDIVAVGEDINQTTFDLIKEMVDDETDIVTLIYGEGIEEEQVNELVEQIEAYNSDIDIEVICGAQPVYYYLVSAE